MWHLDKHDEETENRIRTLGTIIDASIKESWEYSGSFNKGEGYWIAENLIERNNEIIELLKEQK